MALVMADALIAGGHAVRLWAHDRNDVESLAKTRRSPRRLPDFVLDERVLVTPDDDQAFKAATLVLNAIPAQFTRSVWERLRPHVPPDVPAISVTKGIENETLLRPTQVIAEATGDDPEHPQRPMCAVSGPTIAAELAKRLPATMVAAAEKWELAQRVQETLGTSWMRIYRHDDVVGVEIAGAVKNVIALAAGMIDGMEAGANAKSALLARGLAEISRLGMALGARLDTFFGVAGVGDLATTCFSPMGRNRTCGERLGRGEKLDAILSASASVVEGVATTRSVTELARRCDVEMPISAAVHAILFEGLEPAEAVGRLMQREPKAERIG
jgi:glycerol-3-phosphate dehydrogenase (NAD(P)+)